MAVNSGICRELALTCPTEIWHRLSAYVYETQELHLLHKVYDHAAVFRLCVPCSSLYLFICQGELPSTLQFILLL